MDIGLERSTAAPLLAELGQSRKPAQVKRGDTLDLDVQGLTLEGDGLAQHEQRAVSVTGAFPGERARGRVQEVSRQHPRARASALSIQVPHPARRAVPCEAHVAHGGACTGCPLMALDESAQRELKRSMLRDNFGLNVAEVEGNAQLLGYRYSAKRVAFAAKGTLRLGSFARGSHRPAPMWNCLVDHPRLAETFTELSARARELAIVAYDEGSAEGDLRYVWAKTDGSRVIVTLITGHAQSRAADELPGVLASVAGVLHSVQGGRTNAIRGSAPTLLTGSSELSIELLGEHVGIGALGFLQPNPEVAALAYAALLDSPPGALALDLYAGIGLTTRILGRTHTEVMPCELYPESAAALGVAPQDAASFLGAFIASQPQRVPDLVVANPPRQGLGELVCEHLSRLGPERVHLMSCGPEGLARDLGRLHARYELIELRAFDTLPQTPHVELVAKLKLRR